MNPTTVPLDPQAALNHVLTAMHDLQARFTTMEDRNVLLAQENQALRAAHAQAQVDARAAAAALAAAHAQAQAAQVAVAAQDPNVVVQKILKSNLIEKFAGATTLIAVRTFEHQLTEAFTTYQLVNETARIATVKSLLIGHALSSVMVVGTARQERVANDSCSILPRP